MRSATLVNAELKLSKVATFVSPLLAEAVISVSAEIVDNRDDFQHAPGEAVAQVSKSALQWLRLCRAADYAD